MATKSRRWMENAEVLQQKVRQALTYLQEQKQLSSVILGILVLIAGGIWGYRWYINDQDQEARREVFNAIYYFEADSLDLALLGDGNSLGFEDIIAQYGSTPTGNLSRFYAGVISLKQARYDTAIQYLEEFSAKDLLVQARAYALIGDAYLEQAAYEDASAWYKKAANYNPNEWFSPIYWQKAAIAYEENQYYEQAAACYKTILDEHYSSPLRQEAQTQQARLAALASSPPITNADSTSLDSTSIEKAPTDSILAP